MDGRHPLRAHVNESYLTAPRKGKDSWLGLEIRSKRVKRFSRECGPLGRIPMPLIVGMDLVAKVRPPTPGVDRRKRDIGQGLVTVAHEHLPDLATGDSGEPFLLEALTGIRDAATRVRAHGRVVDTGLETLTSSSSMVHRSMCSPSMKTGPGIGAARPSVGLWTRLREG